MQITKDMLIGDVIRQKPETIKTLLNIGLGCIGCPSRQVESIEQAATVHGIDVDELVRKLNA
jgi:hybrid cluster-associated redox disulfide protein